MKHLDIVGISVAIAATITQADETLRLVQTILTCIAIAVSLVASVYKLYVNARAKKLSDKELEEFAKSLSNNINEVNKVIDKYKDSETK